jgi:hypothetical protein
MTATVSQCSGKYFIKTVKLSSLRAGSAKKMVSQESLENVHFSLIEP